jgi:tRNA modification GTPase
LLDASEAIQAADLDILHSLPATPVIIVVNKVDLPQMADLSGWKELSQTYPVVSLSAKERTGLDELEQMIEKLVFNETAHLSEELCLDNDRQFESLMIAREQLCAAVAALENELPLDCVVIDLRAAVQSLGKITGETVSDEVVREIFAKFCLGK